MHQSQPTIIFSGYDVNEQKLTQFWAGKCQTKCTVQENRWSFHIKCFFLNLRATKMRIPQAPRTKVPKGTLEDIVVALSGDETKRDVLHRQQPAHAKRQDILF
jgi:hypothetical protein